MSGRKHTIKTHPRLEEIKDKIISESVVYREIAEEYGVSLSAIKHFAAEIKNEPTNRDIAGHFHNHETQERINIHEQQKLEAEADLRSKKDSEQEAQDKDIRRREYAEAGVLPEVQRYAPGDIRHQSTARKPEDPGWRPGFQPVSRQLEILRRQAEKDQEERIRNWDPLNNW